MQGRSVATFYSDDTNQHLCCLLLHTNGIPEVTPAGQKITLYASGLRTTSKPEIAQGIQQI